MPILSDGAKFLKASATPNGTIVRIKSEGEWIVSTRFKYADGNPQQQFVVEIEENGNRNRLTLNKGNRETLIKAFGNDTKKWINKEIRLNILLALVSGQKKQVFDVEPLGETPTIGSLEEVNL